MAAELDPEPGASDDVTCAHRRVSSKGRARGEHPDCGNISRGPSMRAHHPHRRSSRPSSGKEPPVYLVCGSRFGRSFIARADPLHSQGGSFAILSSRHLEVADRGQAQNPFQNEGGGRRAAGLLVLILGLPRRRGQPTARRLPPPLVPWLTRSSSSSSSCRN